jgi:GxxExxY protein
VILNENQIAKEVLDAAFKIHSFLGPGLFESVYESILMHELKKRSFKVHAQIPVPLEYDGLRFECAFRADLIVNSSVIIEAKSGEKLDLVHSKQLLTYVKLTDLRLGLLINFGEAHLRDGIRRIVNKL